MMRLFGKNMKCLNRAEKKMENIGNNLRRESEKEG
jgi:hypothetical protein